MSFLCSVGLACSAPSGYYPARLVFHVQPRQQQDGSQKAGEQPLGRDGEEWFLTGSRRSWGVAKGLSSLLRAPGCSPGAGRDASEGLSWSGVRLPSCPQLLTEHLESNQGLLALPATGSTASTWEPSSGQPTLLSGGMAGTKPPWAGRESGSAWRSHPGGDCPLFMKAGCSLRCPLPAARGDTCPSMGTLPRHPRDVGSDGSQPWICSIIIRKMMWSRPCPTADTPLQEPGSALQLH